MSVEKSKGRVISFFTFKIALLQKKDFYGMSVIFANISSKGNHYLFQF